jgi:hypothetical protein
MRFQFQFLGGSVPQNTRVLVCPRCEDGLQYQNMLLVIPPDPSPFFNTNPEPYAADETNLWLTGGDDTEPIIVEGSSGTPITTWEASPEDANACSLTCAMLWPGGTITSAYLDLYDGDPADGGTSILATITGSATRTNIASQLTTSGGIALNTEQLDVVAAALATANISYAAIWDSATAGTLLASGTVSTEFPTIVSGAPVLFLGGALTINLNT